MFTRSGRLAFVTALALVAGPSAWAEPPRPDGKKDAADLLGDPLPDGTTARLGTVRFRRIWHRSPVLSFSPDGRTLLAVTDEWVQAWDVGTGRERIHFHPPPGTAWAVTPDGNTLVTAVPFGRAVRTWDTATGKVGRELTRPGHELGLVALSPDGKVVAAVAADVETGASRLCTWDLATGKAVADFPLTPTGDETFRPVSLSFAAGGAVVAVTVRANGATRVRFWDVATGKERPLRVEDADDDRGPTLSPDGKLLATVLRQEKGVTVRLVDAETGDGLRDAAPPLPVPEQATFSPDGRTVAAWGRDGGLALWDTATGKQLPTPAGGEANVRQVLFSPDGKTVAVVEERAVHVSTTATGKLVHKLDTAAPADDLARYLTDAQAAFSPDGKLLAVARDWDRVVRVWDLGTGKETRFTQAAHEDVVSSAAVAADAKTVASASMDGTVRLWDPATGRQVRVLDLPWLKDRPSFNADRDRGPCLVALAADGKTLAAASPFGVVRLWDAAGKQTGQFTVPEGGVASLALTPDGRTVITGGRGWVQAWDAATGKVLCRFATPDSGWPETARGGNPALLQVAVSPDGRLLAATGERDGYLEVPDSTGLELKVWELATGKVRRQAPAGDWPRRAFDHPTEPPPPNRTRLYGPPLVAFAADGKTLVWNPGETLELLDLVTGKPLRRLGGSSAPVAALAYSPAGDVVAVAHGDAVRLYDPANGTLLGTLRGHGGEVHCLAFGPDGKTLVSGGDDTTLLVWDVPRVLESERARAKKLGADGDALWKQLASAEGTEAAAAMERLEAAPADAVALLGDRLRPVAVVEARQVARLVADLGDEKVEVRKRAAAELERLAELAEPALRKRLEAGPSADVRQCVEQLLDKLGGFVTRPEQVRALRAVEVLEHLGSAEAKEVLRELAKGTADARLTREAKAALDRLAKRPAVP
jgi:WD40 repeat protein